MPKTLVAWVFLVIGVRVIGLGVDGATTCGYSYTVSHLLDTSKLFNFSTFAGPLPAHLGHSATYNWVRKATQVSPAVLHLKMIITMMGTSKLNFTMISTYSATNKHKIRCDFVII